VRLFADEEADEAGRSWEAEIGRRYRERIAPVLARLKRPLEVRVRFERFGTGAALSASAQIGNRPIRTKEPGTWEVVIAGPGRP
jgi:hypothetical protein